MAISYRKSHPIQRRMKYSIDQAIAACILLLLLPLLVPVYLLVKIFMGSPAFFTQERAGHWGESFTCYKFRSMTDARNQNGQLLPDKQRLTPFGKLLRRTKIDELPQLWNIVTGEMSFVGPRPTLPVQVRDYDAYARTRLTVRPGLTGWAQVNGNIQLSWPNRIHLDVWYIRHWSLWLDVAILFKTLGVVIWGEHPSEEALNKAVPKTMPRKMRAKVNVR